MCRALHYYVDYVGGTLKIIFHYFFKIISDLYITDSGNFHRFRGRPNTCELDVLIVPSRDCGQHPQDFVL